MLGSARVAAALAALILALGPVMPGVAHAGRTEDKAVDRVNREAERMLRRLDYQRARELLEATARDGKTRKARASTRARVWALLGWARAELGDVYGTDDAFLKAVVIDRKVRLPRGVSPKIVDALERARTNAPLGEGETPPPPPDPEPEPSSPEPPPEPKPEPRPEPKPEPTRPRIEPRPKPERRRPPRKTPRRPRPAPSPGVVTEPGLELGYEGRVVPGGRIRLVAELEDAPSSARVVAMVKRAGAARAEPLPMSRTGTIATAELDVGDGPIEVYARLELGGRTLVTDPPASEPMLLQPEAPPSLAEAWAEPPPAPPPTASSTTAAIAVLPPPEEETGSDGVETWVWVGAGAAVVITAAIIAVVVASGGSADCSAEGGFGCVEVQVLPLASF